MVNITVNLDKRKAKKDGTYPICFGIYQTGKSTTRSSKIYIKENQWNENSKSVRKSHPNSFELNKLLKSKLAELQSNLLVADSNRVSEYLKPKVVDQKIEIITKTLYEFANDLVLELKKDNKIGNAWVYQSTINALKGYNADESLKFEDLTFGFLDGYSKFLLRRGVKPNTAFLYLRTIRALYNKAIQHRLVDRSLYPFHDLKLKGEKTRKRAVDKQLLKTVLALSLEHNSTIWHVRNWFMLSFYLMGISIVDLALLTKANVKSGRIQFKRQKTGKLYDIKIVPQAKSILNNYAECSHGDYLLPIINRNVSSEQERLRLIKDRTRLANKYLKRIADLLETDDTITTYTARHSWATICKKLGFSKTIK
jgi:site-specific recombinase XerD